jgi:hypothetical protein
MKFKHFTYPGNWFTRAWVFYNYKLRGYYIANIVTEVPFYKQYDKKGQEYRLKNGTRCFISSLNVVVELNKDRWLAVGDSPEAKRLNAEIDYYNSGDEQSQEQILAEMRRHINQGNQSVADRIIQKELDQAGVRIAPVKDFNN